jgi:hypothetical protein
MSEVRVNWVPSDRSARICRAVEGSELLCTFISQIEAQCNRLPLFMRPIARNVFRRNAGQTIEDWLGTAGNLKSHLIRIQRGDATAGHSFGHIYPAIEILLHQLIRFCHSFPGEASRYTSDPGLLRDLRNTMNRKAEMILTLMAELRFLHRDHVSAQAL